MGLLPSIGILATLLGGQHAEAKSVTIAVVAKPAYNAGEPIEVSFVIGNDAAPLAYVSQGSLWQHVKLVVRNASGREPLMRPLGLAMRAGYGAKADMHVGLPLQWGHQMTFQAGVSLQQIFVLKPGVYTLVARFAAQPPGVPKEVSSKPIKLIYGKVGGKRKAS